MLNTFLSLSLHKICLLQLQVAATHRGCNMISLLPSVSGLLRRVADF